MFHVWSWLELWLQVIALFGKPFMMLDNTCISQNVSMRLGGTLLTSTYTQSAAANHTVCHFDLSQMNARVTIFIQRAEGNTNVAGDYGSFRNFCFSCQPSVTRHSQSWWGNFHMIALTITDFCSCNHHHPSSLSHLQWSLWRFFLFWLVYTSMSLLLCIWMLFIVQSSPSALQTGGSYSKFLRFIRITPHNIPAITAEAFRLERNGFVDAIEFQGSISNRYRYWHPQKNARYFWYNRRRISNGGLSVNFMTRRKRLLIICEALAACSEINSLIKAVRRWLAGCVIF